MNEEIGARGSTPQSDQPVDGLERQVEIRCGVAEQAQREVDAAGGRSREIARGLAALGFRYDGMGGFDDGRVPANRDLAVAVGQAGLLPVKIRHWPSAEEAANLLQGVHVSADTFIAARAPALTIGELVRMPGRRAEYLADLWNDWPLCRPLLFSTGP